MAKSKFFRVATEGATTDGRTIQRSWLEQMAANYDPKKYGSRVWLEHIRSLFPDSDFRAYGDVVAVKTEENSEGKLELYAQIEPTSDLIELNKKKQKMYTSMEIDLDFADTGECYLTGLAVTDSPASLGTEMLQFSAKQQVSPLASRKTRPENLFSEAVELELELEEEPEAPEEKPSLFSRVTALLKKAGEKNSADFSDVNKAVEAIATEAGNLKTEFSAALKTSNERCEKLEGEVSGLTEQLEAQKSAFAELKSQLENTPDGPTRTPASGAPLESDCL